MFERYTERARRVIFFACKEAVQFGSPTIESEHLLLGLFREDKDLTLRFLPNHASIEIIRRDIEARTTIREKISPSTDLPLSNECKRILAYAAEENERLLHPHIGTEHLLLGILREERCMAAEILQQYGPSVNAIREELVRSPMPVERRVSFLPYEMGSNPALSEGGRCSRCRYGEADCGGGVDTAIWCGHSRETGAGNDRTGKARTQVQRLDCDWLFIKRSATVRLHFQTNGRILDVGGPSKP